MMVLIDMRSADNLSVREQRANYTEYKSLQVIGW